jgi:hypothetical protein
VLSNFQGTTSGIRNDSPLGRARNSSHGFASFFVSLGAALEAKNKLAKAAIRGLKPANGKIKKGSFGTTEVAP